MPNWVQQHLNPTFYDDSYNYKRIMELFWNTLVHLGWRFNGLVTLPNGDEVTELVLVCKHCEKVITKCPMTLVYDFVKQTPIEIADHQIYCKALAEG